LIDQLTDLIDLLITYWSLVSWRNLGWQNWEQQNLDTV